MKLRKKRKQLKTLIRLNKEEFPKRLKAESNSSKDSLKLNEKQVRERLKKLKELRVKLARINVVITWDSFIEYIHRETRKKIEGNYLIIYTRYLEDNLHYLYDEFMAMRRTRRSATVVKPPSRVYERIDDKIDIGYISNLERRLSIYYKKIELLKKNSLNNQWKKKLLNNKRISENITTLPRRTNIVEKKVNEYITVRLEYGKTYIYVNGKKFIQCIRLILNIPKSDTHLYEEIDSIDEAAKLYSKHVFQNRIVRGPMAAPVPNQRHIITHEQEFWGHCSNIQAWVEHDYDTRILMTNISFPLLRELAKAGDPLAKKIYKEEIALRLESGYPSVVQYLLTQGYIQVFSPDEFKTILETSSLIKNFSSEPKMLSQFLRSCISKFPTLLEVILLQILKLPDGKNLLNSSFINPRSFPLRSYVGYRLKFLLTLKTSLEKLFKQADERIGEDIIDCIHIIEKKLAGQEINLPNLLGKSRTEAIKRFYANMILGKFEDEEKLLNAKKKSIKMAS